MNDVLKDKMRALIALLTGGYSYVIFGDCKVAKWCIVLSYWVCRCFSSLWYVKQGFKIFMDFSDTLTACDEYRMLMIDIG